MVEPVGEGSGPEAPGRGRHRRLLVTLTVLLVVVAVPVGALGFAAVHLSGNLTRLDGVFDGLSDRPAVPQSAAGATNILVVGTDRGTDAGGAQRHDRPRPGGRSQRHPDARSTSTPTDGPPR